MRDKLEPDRLERKGAAASAAVSTLTRMNFAH